MEGSAVVTVPVVALLAGAIPFSNLLARAKARVDLRGVGTGTVSSSGLYPLSGFGAVALAGCLDIAKGTVGPLLAGDRPGVAAAAACAAVVGHNWSPFLGGAGGRGLSPAMGGLLVIAWPGTLLVLAGIGAGKLLDHTGLGTFLALLALPILLGVLEGPFGALVGVLVVAPILLKRVLGNRRPAGPNPAAVRWHRLLYDNDGAV